MPSPDRAERDGGKNNDEKLLRNLVEHPFDERPRKLYAAWLDKRGDPRAEFLHLQQEFARPPADAKGYRDLCKREATLVRQLDPGWFHRVQKFTTATPCRNIAALVPELAVYGRTTIRLHPHRMVGNRSAEESNIGGHFLWPEEEEWPNCPECKVPLVPVLQLRRY